MTLIPYLDGTENFYLFILVTYRPIKNLSNVMLLKQLINIDECNFFNRPTSNEFRVSERDRPQVTDNADKHKY